MNIYTWLCSVMVIYVVYEIVQSAKQEIIKELSEEIRRMKK